MKLIRGTEYLPIGTRTDIKSMASVKNFARFALKGHKDAVEWIKVYAADLAGRIIEICEEKIGIPKRLYCHSACSALSQICCYIT